MRQSHLICDWAAADDEEQSDLWKSLRAAWSNIPCGVDFIKVPAHMELHDVWSGPISLRDVRGNLCVDKAACETTKRGQVPDQVRVSHTAIKSARRRLHQITKINKTLSMIQKTMPMRTNASAK